MHHNVDDVLNSVASKVVMPTRVTGVKLATNEKSPKTVTQTDPDAGKKDKVESLRHSGVSILALSQLPITEDSKVKVEAFANSANKNAIRKANNKDVGRFR